MRTAYQHRVGGAEGASMQRVGIADMKFQPNPATIRAGGSIIFQNYDTADHSVTFEGYDQYNDSNKVNNAQFTDYFLPRGVDEEVEVVFPTPGVFPYFDRLHEGPGLTGTIEVIGTVAGETAPTPQGNTGNLWGLGAPRLPLAPDWWKQLVGAKPTWNRNGNGNGLEADPWRTPLMLALIPLAGVAGYFGYQYLK